MSNDEARRHLERAHAKAESLGHSHVDFQHLLWADLDQQNKSVIASTLSRLTRPEDIAHLYRDLDTYFLQPEDEECQGLSSDLLRLVEVLEGISYDSAGGHNLEYVYRAARLRNRPFEIDWATLIAGPNP